MGAWSKHDDVIKWKHFPRYWPFVRGIHRSPVNFPTQRPVTRRSDVFFDLRLYKRLNKQSRGWWFEAPSLSLWRHCNANSWHKFAFRRPGHQHYGIGPSVAFLNGRNSHRSCEPIITCDTRKFQHIFRPTNHKMVISANWIPHWQSHCHTTTVS